MLLEPKDQTVTDRTGKEKVFIISKFPATVGREIAAKYPVSILPKIGDYAVSEATMLLAMTYVAVPSPTPGGVPLQLTTKELVNNHVTDAEMLLKLEMAMMEHNFSFFGNGKSLDFFAKGAEMFKQWIISTLTDLSVASSKPGKRHSKNSARNTR